MGFSHQDKLLAKVSEMLRSLNCIRPGDRILIGLSGGKDSMTLLSALYELRPEFKYSLIAVYIDHRVRAASKDEAQSLGKFCDDLKIPFFAKTIEDGPGEKGTSPEEWLRDERYRCLDEVAGETASNWIATGHHADDLVETVLFRLSQGAGIAGLSGIPSRRNNIIRPLSAISRTEIDQYIEKVQLPYFEDETNLNFDVPRNFIRHRILKEWKKSSPEVIPGIARSVGNIAEVSEALQYWETILAEKIDTVEPGTFKLDKNWFDVLPVYIRARLILRQVSDGLSRRDIWERIKEFLVESRTGNLLNLSENWTLLNERKDWILSQNFSPEKVSLRVNSGVAYECGSYVFTAERENTRHSFDETPSIEWVDADRIDQDSLILRPWKHGDSFIPLGMKSRKKISDLLTDEKVSRWHKERQFVLTSNDEIIWVCGLRISDKVKVTGKTINFIKLSWLERNEH